MGDEVEFKWAEGRSKAFEDAAKVRHTVFCQEQGYAQEIEIDETDNFALHVIGYIKERPVCTARLFWDAPQSAKGQNAAGGAMHVGRVAVLKPFRGQGFGRLIMQKLEEKAAQLLANAIVLNAQVPSSAFYKALGYKAKGGVFLEEGQPHIKMVKSFNSKPAI